MCVMMMMMMDDGDRDGCCCFGANDYDDYDDNDSHAIKLEFQDPNSFSSSTFSLNGPSSSPAAAFAALLNGSSSALAPEQSRSDVMHSRDRDSGGKFTVKQGPKIGTHNGCKRSYLGVKLKRKYLSSDNYSTLMKTAHVRLEESMIPIPISKQMSMPITTTAVDPSSLSSDMFSPTDPYMQLIGVADQLLSTGGASSDGGSTDGGIELEQQNSSMQQKYEHFNDVFQQQYQEQQQQQQHQGHQGHHQQHQYEYGHYSNNFGGASNSSSSSHMMPAQHSTKNNPHRVYHSHTIHQPSNHIPYYGGVNSQMIHTSRVGQQQQQPESASSRVTAAVKAMVAQQQQTSMLFRADKDFQLSGRLQQQQQKEDKYNSPNFDYSQLFLNSTGNNSNNNNNNNNNKSNNTNNNDSRQQQLLVDTTATITTTTANDATNVRESGDGDVSGIDDNPNWRDQLHYWVGLISYVSNRKHLQWKGSWLASYVGRPTLDEFTNSGNYFEYDSESVDASQVSSDDGALKPWSCFYSGYYLMDLDGTGAFDKYVDNEFYMDFDLVEKTFSSSKYSVLGKGDNEFGAFIVTGRYDTQSGLLELTRQYVAEDDIRCNMSIHQLKQLLQMISNQARGFV
jgi:hypothetical protein